jgi:hypothetical protein
LFKELVSPITSGPMELDLWLPEFNFAVEYQGTIMLHIDLANKEHIILEILSISLFGFRILEMK